jgi:hypothetical protein
MGKGFLVKNVKQKSRSFAYTIKMSRLLMYLGVVVIVSALILMLLNFQKIDSTYAIWLSLMLAGVFFVFVSQLIEWGRLRFPLKIKND